jgi:hypothetical protein
MSTRRARPTPIPARSSDFAGHDGAWALAGWPRLSLIAAAVGVIGLLLAAVGGFVSGPGAFFRTYLTAYTFWLGLALGSLGIALLQFLTGGLWGLVTRRVFEAAASTLPLLAVLFVPVLFGLPVLYAWARPDAVTADAVLQHKAIYLNVPFFVVRALVYLSVWVALALVLRRWSAAQDEESAPWRLRKLQRFSVVGVLLLAVTTTLAAIDWLMSLDARWYSTMYPPMVAMSGLLLALAFSIVVVGLLAPSTKLGGAVGPGIYNDLGSLLLAFLMLWAYMAYFQYLLIWAGNLSDEIPWYVERAAGGWLPVAVAIAVVGFLLPFWCLLFRPLKRRRATLCALATLVILTRLVDVYWMVRPPFEPDGPVLYWLDPAILVGIGGLWLAVFTWQLAARPLLPRNDPRLARALEIAHA